MKTYFHYNKIDKKYIFPTSFLSYICVIVQIDYRSTPHFKYISLTKLFVEIIAADSNLLQIELEK